MTDCVHTPDPTLMVEKTTALNAHMKYMSDAVQRGMELALRYQMSPDSMTSKDREDAAELADGITLAVQSIFRIADEMVAMNIYTPQMAARTKDGVEQIGRTMAQTLAGPLKTWQVH